jgi:hypothetical protein
MGLRQQRRRKQGALQKPRKLEGFLYNNFNTFATSWLLPRLGIHTEMGLNHLLRKIVQASALCARTAAHQLKSLLAAGALLGHGQTYRHTDVAISLQHLLHALLLLAHGLVSI